VAIIALFVKFELALKALHRAPLPAFKR